VPELQAEFLPTGSGDWTSDVNWTSHPLPYPNGTNAIVIIPPPGAGDRNVNLRAPVTVGEIHFPQSTSTNRNRIRDQNTGNTLTFLSTNGPARIEVGGTHDGYVEFEVLAGTTLASDLRLNVTNIMGNAEFGALRLRANWSGPGWIDQVRRRRAASLTGDAKTYTGHTTIEAGVLFVTQPAAPTAEQWRNGAIWGTTAFDFPQRWRSAGLYDFGGPLEFGGDGAGRGHS
jgi:autotransporter-associated beta strand protein